MAARLAEMGHTVYLDEPMAGGHGGNPDNAHSVRNVALTCAFLRKTIAPEMTTT